MTTVKPPDFCEREVVMGCLITAGVEVVIFLLIGCILYRKGCFGRRLRYIGLDPDPADVDKMMIELEQRDEQITQLKYQLQGEQDEKNDALNRLSACMSNRLRDGNADIADLSDGNRPTKLGERFSELYDNEWTTAYTHVDTKFNKVVEPEVIEFLLTILQECFHTCQTTSVNQMATIDRCITFQDTPSHLSKDLLKKVKDERKMNALKALTSVQEKTMDSLRQRFAGQPLSQCMSSAAVRKYTNLCTEICWLMAVQDPPMIFQFSADSNPGLFKPYTRSGKNVEFVVWPALFVKDEGALVAKGVAQFI